MNYDNSLESLEIKKIKMRNRIIFPAIATNMADKDGYITEEMIDYHLARVRGGSSLNILEASSVHEASAGEKLLKITDDSYVEKLKEFTNRVHEEEGNIGIQLCQGGMATISSSDDIEFIGPSDYKIDKKRAIEAASVSKIKEIIDSFASAAKRAVSAGFDLIELHVGHNESFHTFLSPFYNKREDDYGGSLENRARYLLETIEEIRNNIPEDMILSLKIISQDDYLEGGLELEDIIQVIKWSEEKGVDMISLSRGNMDSDGVKYEVPILGMDMDYNMENLKKIREEIKLPLIYGGGVSRPSEAEKILEDGLADLIAVGRGQLADPNFVRKIEEDNLDELIKCVQCNQGCYDGYSDPLFPNISCVRNPAIGREKEYKRIETEEAQKVAVVGGGIGGIESTIILSERGHEPVLFERKSQLGGQLLYSLNTPVNEELKRSLERRIAYLKELDVEIRMNTKFEDDMVVDENFDSVIIATGADPKILDIKGKKLDNVLTYEDVLSGDRELEGRVIVIGSGSMAFTLVDYLMESDKDLELLMMDEAKKPAGDMGEIKKVFFKEYIRDNNIGLKNGLEFLEIKEDRLIYKHKNKKYEEEMDYLVMACGSVSNKSNYIKQYCQDREIPFYVVGDALIPRKTLDAIAEAANISLFEIE